MDLIHQFPNLSPELQKQILDGPSLPPPRGVTPRLLDPPNLNAVAYAVGGVCLFLALSTFGFRLYGRIAVVKSVHLEDYIGCIAMVFYIGSAVGFYLQGHFGGFQTHTWDLQLRKYRHVLENGLILAMTYSATMLFSKVAILLEWTRIFVPQGTRDAFFWASRVLIALNIIVYVLSIFLQGFACIPINALWTPWINGKCLDKKVIDLATGYFNLFMDAFILILPWKVLWNLNMTPRRKLGIGLLFSVGILTIACAITRIILNTSMNYIDHPGDTNYQYSTIVYFLFIEETLVVLIFSLPPAPKGFIESPIGYHVVQSLRSITSLASLRPGRTMTSGKTNTSDGRDNSYQEATPKDSAEIELTHPANVSTIGHDDGKDHGHSGIVRRIDIESQVESSKGMLKSTLYHNRHPWESVPEPHAY